MIAAQATAVGGCGAGCQDLLGYWCWGGTRPTLLPDFYIGARAAAANLSVLSRGVRPYRNHFPVLRFIGSDG